jgi:hypothetical protein
LVDKKNGLINVTVIPFIEHAYIKHLHSFTIANKRKVLEVTCRAADAITRKYCILPNPYASLPTDTRRRKGSSNLPNNTSAETSTSQRKIQVNHWRIPNKKREILEEYWNKGRREKLPSSFSLSPSGTINRFAEKDDHDILFLLFKILTMVWYGIYFLVHLPTFVGLFYHNEAPPAS